jgi:hypothetical protein
MFISHTHSAEDGLPNLEGRVRETLTSDDVSSLSSVIRSPPATPGIPTRKTMSSEPLFIREVSSSAPRFECINPNNSKDIDSLIELASKVRLSPDVRGYLHDLVVFLRMHRAVAGGVSALATRHFHALIR